MFRSRTTPFRAVALMWALFAFLPHGGLGGMLVWCEGFDGHREIELAWGGSCNAHLDENEATDASRHLEDPSQSHCGACVDTVVGKDSALETRRKTHATPLVATTASPVAHLTATTRRAARPNRPTSTRARARLTDPILRTMRLLI